MKLYKYNQFLGQDIITENLDKAKKLLKERYILMTAAKELGFIKGDLEYDLKDGVKKSATFKDFSEEEVSEIKQKMREVKLTDDVTRGLERDGQFIKLRELQTEVDFGHSKRTYQLDRDNIGWLYMFTYFYFNESIALPELVILYGKLIEAKSLLPNLEVDVNGTLTKKQFDLNFINPAISNNYELLIDGLDRLEQSRKIKRIENDLTPELKKDLKDSPKMIRDQFYEIALGFDQMGKNDDGTVDVEKKEKLYKGFFGQMTMDTRQNKPDGTPNPTYGKMVFSSALRRYKDIRAFIKSAGDYLKTTTGAKGDRIVEFQDQLDNVNKKLGVNGAELIFNNNGIVIIEVKSYKANQLLNSHTSHCIKDSMSQWNSYVGNTDNKQYYIYNFNLPQFDNNYTIGVTIEPGQRIRAAHNKPDHSVGSSIKSTLKSWESEYDINEDLWKYLAPMTSDEIQKRERAKIANREIVKPELTITQIRKYVVEDGADINTDECRALLNAVTANDLEKSEAILDLGGSPNLKEKKDSIINSASSLDMIKLLVKNGSELTGQVFTTISHDLNAVQFCLDNGLDPNFDNSLGLRRCCTGSWKSRNEMGESYFEVFKLLVENGARLTTNQRDMLMKWAAEYNRYDIIEYAISQGLKHGFKSALMWVKHSTKIGEKERPDMVKYLEDKVQEYES